MLAFFDSLCIIGLTIKTNSIHKNNPMKNMTFSRKVTVTIITLILAFSFSACGNLVTDMQNANAKGTQTTMTAKQCGIKYYGDAAKQANCILTGK